ncbi:MAG: hypothetical protein ACRD1C_14520, partial [Terriglobales bacterium]
MFVLFIIESFKPEITILGDTTDSLLAEDVTSELVITGEDSPIEPELGSDITGLDSTGAGVG